MTTTGEKGKQSAWMCVNVGRRFLCAWVRAHTLVCVCVCVDECLCVFVSAFCVCVCVVTIYIFSASFITSQRIECIEPWADFQISWTMAGMTLSFCKYLYTFSLLKLFDFFVWFLPSGNHSVLCRTSTIVRWVPMWKVIKMYCSIYFQNFWIRGNSQKRNAWCNLLHHFNMNTFDHPSLSSCKVICLSDICYAKVSIVKPIALFL